MPTNTTTDRLDILKTYKLFIDGKSPRSESGRTTTILNAKGQPLAYTSRASRKDLREAVESARRAQSGWASSTAYLRAQIVYRIAEMLEGRRAELIEAIQSVAAPTTKSSKKSSGKSLTPPAEVSVSVDRLVHYAGWADKFSQVLGWNNPVAGPHYNFTVPEPTGVVAVIAPPSATPLGPPVFIENDYPRARDEALRRGLPLVVFAWSPWCTDCLGLRAYVFSDEALTCIGTRFVWLALDVDDPQNAAFWDRFPVERTPTLWVLEPERQRPIFIRTSPLTTPELEMILAT